MTKEEKQNHKKMDDITAEAQKLINKTLDDAKDKLEEAKIKAEKQIIKGIEKTRKLKFYLLKFAFRIAVFLIVFVMYILHRDWLTELVTTPFFSQFTPLHIIWGVFMLIMISHLIPNNKLSMAWRKARKSVYRPVENYDRLKLLEHVQKMNSTAWKVMLLWLSFNAIFAILYLVGILWAGDLIMLTVFYFLSDYICILLFCPFQTGIMKNKCCINCRIYDWGHFMMFTPMLFIKNFFSWSLFFTSLVVLIHWELQYAEHPERFWEGSNKTLQCRNCQEKTCQIKKKLAGKR